VNTFRSHPDLNPPTIEITAQAHDTAPGYIFVAPKQRGPAQGGLMILDNRGQVVWFHPMQGAHVSRVMDFKVQHYRGKPVLTWWEGRGEGGHTFNEYVIADDSYREITRVRAGNGYQGDQHEFQITPQGTALLTIIHHVPRDLSSVGGPEDGAVLGGIAQEIDIETGEVLFEWHSLDHVELDESYLKPGMGPTKYFDYFHINSIDVDHDGNWIISARNTSTIYKIDRKGGEIIWRLGGKESDFEMESDARPAYQHDARRQPDGTLTIFDNGTLVLKNGRPPQAVEESRGIVLDLNEDEMTATLVREYTHPDKMFADAGGNMQVLPNGNVFIGWGRAPAVSEFSKDGELLFSASFPPKNQSYRAFRFPWSGQPSDQPVTITQRASGDRMTLYASWNGATDVTTWQVLAGSNPDQLKPVGSASRRGFETTVAVRTAKPYVAVQAKDASGQMLGTTKAVKLGD